MPRSRAREDKYRSSPKGRYHVHRWNARLRGVPFLLSFEQWWEIWSASGMWELRGNKAGRYVMARKNDEGAYAVGNVDIVVWSRNVADRNRSHAKRQRLTAEECDVPLPD